MNFLKQRISLHKNSIAPFFLNKNLNFLIQRNFDKIICSNYFFKLLYMIYLKSVIIFSGGLDLNRYVSELIADAQSHV